MRQTGGVTVLVGLLLLLPLAPSALAQEKPRYGGELVFAVASEPPSYDGHREETFGLIHPLAPFYSLLMRVDPNDPNKLVGDLAESWSVSRDGLTYTFKLRRGVKFHSSGPVGSFEGSFPNRHCQGGGRRPGPRHPLRQS